MKTGVKFHDFHLQVQDMNLQGKMFQNVQFLHCNGQQEVQHLNSRLQTLAQQKESLGKQQAIRVHQNPAKLCSETVVHFLNLDS